MGAWGMIPSLVGENRQVSTKTEGRYKVAASIMSNVVLRRQMRVTLSRPQEGVTPALLPHRLARASQLFRTCTWQEPVLASAVSVATDTCQVSA
jgi:hypothetical protein